MIIKNRGLRYIFLLVLLLSITVPLLNIFVFHPRYDQLLVVEKESEAVRVARHVSRGIVKLEEKMTLTPAMIEKAEFPGLMQDFNIIKIKVFDHEGRVVFSSSEQDIGTVNTHDYFFDVVAQGKQFTKVVAKKTPSLEGGIFEQDVVETYVPILVQGIFRGAFEIYYDVTALRDRFHHNFNFFLLLQILVSLSFVGVSSLLFFRLDAKMDEHEQIRNELAEKQQGLLEEQEKQTALFSQVERAKRQWEQTMDCLGDMVVMTDTGLRIQRFNRAVCAFTGKGYHELIGRKWTEIINDHEMEKRDFSGKAFEYFHTPTGKWFYLSLYTFKGSNGRLEGFVITMHDLTEIKEVSRQLEETNQQIENYNKKLQKAFDEFGTLIGRVVHEEKFVYFQNSNLSSCNEFMKCGKKECPCYGNDAQRCWQIAGTFCGQKPQGQFVDKHETCSRCPYFESVLADPLDRIGEQFNNMMFMLEAKNSELKTAYQELQQTQSHLLQHEKMASIGQLAAGVAHEINNPVGFISSNLGSLGKYCQRLAEFIALLEKTLVELQGQEALLELREQKKNLKIDFILEDLNGLIAESLDGCSRVKKIVQDLKGFSRVDQADRQRIDIHECLESALNIVWNELKYNCTVVKEYGAVDLLECYPQQLNQVFMNILVNASHAIEAKGEITIKTWQQERAVYVSITDTGCGIAPEALTHIFEPFFTTKEVGKGTGLGLSIVYDIIKKNHNGDITVVSEVGRGTTFTLCIPITDAAEENSRS